MIIRSSRCTASKESLYVQQEKENSHDTHSLKLSHLSEILAKEKKLLKIRY